MYAGENGWERIVCSKKDFSPFNGNENKPLMLMRADECDLSHPIMVKVNEDRSCEVCGNIPDEEGVLEHGRGCYKLSEDGGGREVVL